MNDERRKHERHPVIFGSDIDSDVSEAKLGLTQDVSSSGARLLTISPYGVGTTLKLRIVVGEGDVTEREAKVVWVQDVDDRGMWPCEIAVKFVEPIPDDVVDRLREVSAERES